jgi:hypothetical protein
MGQVTVTRKFKDDFDVWAEYKVRWGDFTKEEIDELKIMLRKDFAPGPDQLRAGVEIINEAGVAVPAMIDNYEDRIKCWTDYFAASAAEIRESWRKAA